MHCVKAMRPNNHGNDSVYDVVIMKIIINSDRQLPRVPDIPPGHSPPGPFPLTQTINLTITLTLILTLLTQDPNPNPNPTDPTLAITLLTPLLTLTIPEQSINRKFINTGDKPQCLHSTVDNKTLQRQ